MKLRNALTGAIACAMSLTALANAANSAPASQCLSPDERGSVGRLASIMALGVAVQRCGKCLDSDTYAQAIKSYDAAGLDEDFSKAEKAFSPNDAKFTYIDVLVRDSARNIAAGLSANCGACEKTAETLKGLASESARGDFYERETAALADMKESAACP